MHFLIFSSKNKKHTRTLNASTLHFIRNWVFITYYLFYFSFTDFIRKCRSNLYTLTDNTWCLYCWKKKYVLNTRLLFRLEANNDLISENKWTSAMTWIQLKVVIFRGIISNLHKRIYARWLKTLFDALLKFIQF